MPDLTVELITQLIANSTAPLLVEISKLKQELETKKNEVLEYETQTIDEQIKCEETLDVIKSLPDFSGKHTAYVSWREAAYNCMSLYKINSRKYFAALTILRNKITANANDVLTNHGTVLNFEAIIARLDFAYSDRRPIHIVEEELSVLRQNNMSVVDFYNSVNKKLTLLINKTIMTHGTDSSVTKELNAKNRAYALRVFITGLNPPLSNIIHSMTPKDLPNALAAAQEIESNEQRALFTEIYYSYKNKTNNNNYYNNNKNRNVSQNHKTHQNHNTLRYPKRETNTRPNNSALSPPEPMEVDPSTQIYRQATNYPHHQNQRNNPNSYQQPTNYPHPQNQKNNPNSSRFNPNQFQPKGTFQKRIGDSTQTNQPKPKNQRINNITENHFLGDWGQSDCHSSIKSTGTHTKN